MISRCSAVCYDDIGSYLAGIASFEEPSASIEDYSGWSVDVYASRCARSLTNGRLGHLRNLQGKGSTAEEDRETLGLILGEAMYV